MAVGSFEVGQRFELESKRCRLSRALDEGFWQYEEISSGRIHEKSQTELLTQWTKGTLIFAGDGPEVKTAISCKAFDQACVDAFRQSYSEQAWKLAQGRLVFVERLRFVPVTREVMQPIVLEIWDDKSLWKGGRPFMDAPSFATVASWIRNYRRAGEDVRALINRDHAKGRRELELDPIVDQIIDDAIDEIYMTLERQDIEKVRAHACGLIAKRNIGRLPSAQLTKPSYALLKRKIYEISPYERWCARYGKRIADIKFRASGQVRLTETPMARASMDHTRLDVMVVDDKTGLPLGRPWLTLLLDEATRYVLGYYIGFEEPSSVSVTRAIRCALMPKTNLLLAYPDIKSQWDAWGVLREIIVDNGLEFHGEVIRAGAGRFGITIQFTPRKKPWFKGKIERYFGTLGTDLLSTIPGKTFSSVLEKNDYDPSKHAVLRLSTLREIICTWIVDVYHNKPHHGLEKATPAQAWAQTISGVDRWLPESSLQVESAFSRSETRRLTHKGIEHDSLFYNGPDMQVLRKAFGSEIDVEIRVMDEDLGSLIVVSPDKSQLISVPAVDQRYAAGLTRWQHEVCKRYKRRLYEDGGQDITLFEARERIRMLIKKDKELIKRATRKRQARFEETSSSPPMQPTVPDSPAPAAQPTPHHPTARAAKQRPVETLVAALTVLPAIPNLPARRIATN
jgi:putative transposase